MGREDVTGRSVLRPVQQAQGERHLAPGDCHCVLAGRGGMRNPITYAVRRGPELTEEGVLRERLGIHGWYGELLREGFGAAHHLDPLASDVEVRVPDGPLLADLKEIRIATQGVAHACPDLLYRLPGPEGGSVHEVDDLP